MSESCVTICNIKLNKMFLVLLEYFQHNNCTNETENYDLVGNETYHCNNCTDCLGMTPDNYNLLYAIYAWT